MVDVKRGFLADLPADSTRTDHRLDARFRRADSQKCRSLRHSLRPQPQQSQQFRRVHKPFRFIALARSQQLARILTIQQRLQASGNRSGESEPSEFAWWIDINGQSHENLRRLVMSTLYHPLPR
jgi:hypothetical protein